MKLVFAAAAVVLGLSACSSVTSTSPAPSSSPPAASTGSTSASAVAAPQPTGSTTVLATGLDAPWSIVRLTSGSTLLSERDSGRVVELTPEGNLREVGIIAGVAAAGEGGLLGLAVAPEDEATLFAYLTTTSDNRIVRMPLVGTSGTYSIGASTVVLDGLEKAGNHDGGRIAFGPDNMLYATVGDAGVPDRAQDLDSLNGKILRMAPDGGVPSDNPFDGSLVYSYGHRNPQGIAWDAGGQLYAAEFGQDTWDEFNRIDAGGNYGWPVVEGETDDDRFRNPLVQWPTDDASPSGLAFVGGSFFLAALKGERLWVPGVDGSARDFFVGEFGRIRDVTAGPDGTLWMLTSNTDGRGSPGADDDQLIQVDLG